MRKHPGMLHWLVSCPSSAETMEMAFRFYADRPCLGHRERTIVDGKSVLNQSYTWFTYQEIWDKVVRIASSLLILNENVGKQEFVGICSMNRYEWFLADLATMYNGMVSVGLPRTKLLVQDLSDIEAVIENAETRYVFCSAEVLNPLVKASKKCPSIKYIIQFEKDIQLIEKNESGVNIMNLDDFMKLSDDKIRDIVVLPPDALKTLVFTSGSTGAPKGAMITEEKWSKGIQKVYWPYHPLVCASFSPLDHMSDRQNVITTLMNGGRVGIYSNDMELIYEDLKILGPVMLSSTPRLFNRLFKEYQNQITISKNLGVGQKEQDEILTEFSKSIGNRIKAITVGGAPSSQEVINFMKECFKIPIYNGYASTECGAIFIVSGGKDDDKQLFDGVELKLVDVPELNYYTTDKPCPRGEICVKSNDCILGYYKNPDKTSELINDGWYHTGDIGQLNENGKYSIIDRKKSFFKLAQGEFVAPEPLELLYLESKFIDQILIYGDTFSNYVVAVVVPNWNVVDEWSKSSPKETLNEKILLEFYMTGTNAKKQSFEIPKGVLIEKEKWTTDNGKMTSSNKIARVVLNKFYKDELAKLYASLDQELTNKDLLNAFYQTLGITSGEEKSFLELGGDSLTAAQISNTFQKRFNLDISADLLLRKDLNLQDLSNLLLGKKHKEFNLEAETKLDESIQPTSTKVKNGRDRIFLTGCTGFLGAFLLENLIKESSHVRVFCLVRCKDKKDGMERIKDHMKAMEINLTEDEWSRIVVVPGDLSKPNLGMDMNIWTIYKVAIDIIYHNGALVNSVYSYMDHKDSNVGSTVELIKLAFAEVIKPFVYISTIGVLGQLRNIKESDSLDPGAFENLGGYPQSKWVAEKLVTEAGKLGLPYLIMRPGLIGSHTTRGSSNKIDWMVRFIAGIAESKTCPISMGGIQMIPVDLVSRLIVEISRIPLDNKVYHLVNQNDVKLSDLYQWMRSSGCKLTEMDPQEWYKMMKETTSKQSIIYPVLDFFSHGFPGSSEAHSIENLCTFYPKYQSPHYTEENIFRMITWLSNHKLITK